MMPPLMAADSLEKHMQDRLEAVRGFSALAPFAGTDGSDKVMTLGFKTEGLLPLHAFLTSTDGGVV